MDSNIQQREGNFEANAFKSITNRIINTALNTKSSIFERIQENDSDFTFCQPDKIPTPGKPLRILDMLPSKIQEKFTDLKYHVLARVLYRFVFKNPGQNSINRWKLFCTKMKDEEKIQNAANAVDRMSKVSRSFIALNAIGSLVKKKEAVLLCKGMQAWKKSMSKVKASITSENIKALKILTVMNKVCTRNFLSFCNEAWRYGEIKKQKEVSDLRSIVKQYGHWEQRINEIEGKLKSENEGLLNKAKCMETENYKLQEILIEKNKDLVEKIAIIESLSAKLKEKAQRAQLEPVNEILCSRCKESLEESHNFGEKGISAIMTEGKIRELMMEVGELNKKLKDKAESELLLRKDLEEQVDLVLKLEEERLILLKEAKLCKEELANSKKVTTDAEVETDPLPFEQPITKKNTIPPKSAKTVKKADKSKKTMSSKKKLLFEKPGDISSSTITEKDISMTSFMSSQIDECKIDTKEALTQEIIKLNRENAKLKKDLRTKEENLKRCEKELSDLKKQLSIKMDAVEKLRRENGEMMVTLQTDQFKSIRILEIEKNKYLTKLNETQKKLTATIQEKEGVEQELQTIRASIESMKITIETLESKLADYKDKAEKYNDVAKEVINTRETIKELRKEKENTIFIKEELVREKEELLKKVKVVVRVGCSVDSYSTDFKVSCREGYF